MSMCLFTHYIPFSKHLSPLISTVLWLFLLWPSMHGGTALELLDLHSHLNFLSLIGCCASVQHFGQFMKLSLCFYYCAYMKCYCSCCWPCYYTFLCMLVHVTWKVACIGWQTIWSKTYDFWVVSCPTTFLAIYWMSLLSIKVKYLVWFNQHNSKIVE